MDLSWTYTGRDQAEWLECLTANATSCNSPGFIPSILRHSGIGGATLNKVQQKCPLFLH
jgi:hypothetical protein